ncbi:MAG: hypothetical protein LBT20_02985, partial [Clostridiales bacterium]|nr:hypothetical protein [Clostridiales bacterium]
RFQVNTSLSISFLFFIFLWRLEVAKTKFGRICLRELVRRQSLAIPRRTQGRVGFGKNFFSALFLKT